MKQLALVFLSVIVSLATARSQVAFGPDLGGTMCTYTSQNSTASLKGGPMAGGRADVKLTGHFCLQPGLYYANNKLSSRSVGGSSPFLNIHTIALPITFVYKGKAGRATAPFIGLGAYAAYNAEGTITIPGGDGPVAMPDI